MPDKILIQVGATNLTSYIKSYKVDYNVLVRDDGRNAAGNATINIVNRKYKLNVVFRPLNETEMAALLTAISSFEMSVQFWDPKTQTQLTKFMYINTPSPDMYWNAAQAAIYKDLSLNFIEE